MLTHGPREACAPWVHEVSCVGGTDPQLNSGEVLASGFIASINSSLPLSKRRTTTSSLRPATSKPSRSCRAAVVVLAGENLVIGGMDDVVRSDAGPLSGSVDLHRTYPCLASQTASERL